jgi:hypothetical protein
MYSVLNAKQDLTGNLHGTTLNQILDIDGLFNRTARQLLLEIDPQETKRIQQFTNPIYNSVYDYAVPSDLKGNRIIDIRPQANRDRNDVLGQIYNQAFDANKLGSTVPNFTIQHNKGTKTIRINAPFIKSGVTLNECDSLTTNGTWTASGDATDLGVNNVNYVSGGSSLKFNLTAAGTVGTLTNSTIFSTDLTEYLNQGCVFAYVYLPTGTDFTNVIIKWGSDAANYWTRTVAVDFAGNTFVNGWNLLGFNWLGATQVGTPDVTQTTYLSFSYTFNGTAQTAVGLDNVVIRLGQILECEYYSKYLFSDATTSGWQETVTDDSNLVNLDTESYNLFLNLLTHFAVQQQQGLNAMRYDDTFFGKAYAEAKKRYQQLYKSEVQKPQSTYYKMPQRGYSNWLTNWFMR